MAPDQPAPLSRALLLRVSRDIFHHVTAAAEESSGFGLPEAAWEHLEGLRRKELKARQRGWRAAAAEMESLVHLSAQSLIRQLHEMCAWQEVAHSRRPQQISMHEIYRDLLNLEGEFAEVRIDRRHRMLTVRTEAIELDEVNLGPFDIVLNWGDIERVDVPFSVVALHPVRCAADEAVTHPHVRSDRLCTGDGKALIALALAHGNLFEFFVLVRQILRTYNPGSAHQQLSSWFASDCEECGCTLDEYEQNSCDRCGSVICNDCCDSCVTCGNYFCQGCADLCSNCSSPVCLRCSESSTDSSSRLCRDCFEEEDEADEPESTNTEETNALENETEKHSPEAAAAESGTAIAAGARCVGEAALPA